jgi:hypothetical protein
MASGKLLSLGCELLLLLPIRRGAQVCCRMPGAAAGDVKELNEAALLPPYCRRSCRCCSCVRLPCAGALVCCRVLLLVTWRNCSRNCSLPTSRWRSCAFAAAAGARALELKWLLPLPRNAQSRSLTSEVALDRLDKAVAVVEAKMSMLECVC